MGASILDTSLNLEELIHFDMGKANVGIVSDGYNAAFCTDIQSWSLQGFNTFNNEDPWNGLSVTYVCKFPVDLILSPTVLDKYRNIFRLLFPLKCLQAQLNKSWMIINFKSKERDNHGDNDLVKMAALRAKMSFVIDSLLSYFYLDVLEVRWARLKESFSIIKEFEELRKNVSGYLESIFQHTFLNFPQVTKNIFNIVNSVKTFLLMAERLESNGLDYEIDVQKVKCEFDKGVQELIRHVESLNLASSTQYLSQLLTRLNFNQYYSPLMNEMDLEIL